MNVPVLEIDPAGEWSRSSLPMGATVGDFLVIRPLGTGATSVVYLAQRVVPRTSSRPPMPVARSPLATVAPPRTIERNFVALKVLHPSLAQDPRFAARFRNEAAIASRVRHANVCTVFDHGSTDGFEYIAMEAIAGKSFGDLLQRAWSSTREDRASLFDLEIGAIRPEYAVRVVAEVSAGLHALHETRADDRSLIGAVHRDLKPDNILIGFDGAVRIADFGLSTMVEQGGASIPTNNAGTLEYMSPEQVRHRALDRRSDVWSLGVVLWEALAGRRLFQTYSPVRTMHAIVHDEIVPPSEYAPFIPSELDAIVMQALERDPDHRWQSAAAIADALVAAGDALPRRCSSRDLARCVTELFPDEVRKAEGWANEAACLREDPTSGLRRGMFDPHR